MTPEQVRILQAKFFAEQINVNNILGHLRSHPETGAKLLADCEKIFNDLDAILEDLDELLKAKESVK